MWLILELLITFLTQGQKQEPILRFHTIVGEATRQLTCSRHPDAQGEGDRWNTDISLVKKAIRDDDTEWHRLSEVK